MKTYIVHYGVRLTCNIEVQADTEDEAIEKSKEQCEATPYNKMTFAKDDYDAWEKRDMFG